MILAPRKPRLLLPESRLPDGVCPRCRRPNSRRARPFWRSRVPLLNANGDTAIDADGNVLVDDNGNEKIAGTAIEDCCCVVDEFDCETFDCDGVLPTTYTVSGIKAIAGGGGFCTFSATVTFVDAFGSCEWTGTYACGANTITITLIKSFGGGGWEWIVTVTPGGGGCATTSIPCAGGPEGEYPDTCAQDLQDIVVS